MNTLNRLVTMLLLLWLPVTLATAGGLRTCPAHQTMTMMAKHHHSSSTMTAHHHHTHNADSRISHSNGCHPSTSQDTGHCTSCIMCHIPASLPTTLVLTQPNPIQQPNFRYFTDHYRSIAIPPADRPPLFS